MTPTDRDKWVKALRSGKYKQIRGETYELSNGRFTGYCCLAVAIEIVGFNLSHEAETYRKLLDMNDGTNGERAHSFPEIADWIEANL